MHKLKKVVILLLIFLIAFSAISFAEVEETVSDEPNWFEKLIIRIAKFLPNTVANGLRAVGPDAEEIYLEGSPFLFSFAQDNIFGAYTAKAYPLFRLIGIIMISLMVYVVGIQLIRSKSGIGKKTAWDQITNLVLGAIALYFLPEIANFGLNVFNQVAVAINNLFNSSETAGFVASMAEIAVEGNVLDALIYLAATGFSYWLMANYIGLTFGTTVLFLFTPVLLAFSPTGYGKKQLKEIGTAFLGYVLTPIFDITLLGIISTVRLLDPEFLGISPVVYNLTSIILVMMVIPTRSLLKKSFGFGSALGDMLGVGTVATAMMMMNRGYNTAKGKKSSSGISHTSEPSGEDYSGKAEYYNDLDKYQGSQSTNNSTTSDLPPIYDTSGSSEEPMSRESFINKHQGNDYFNERDIGGLSNQEKASYYENKAENQQLEEEQMKMAEKQQSRYDFAKKAAKVTGGVLGASTMMFMGGRGMAAGAYVGSQGSGKLFDTSAKGFSAYASFLADGQESESSQGDHHSELNGAIEEYETVIAEEAENNGGFVGQTEAKMRSEAKVNMKFDEDKDSTNNTAASAMGQMADMSINVMYDKTHDDIMNDIGNRDYYAEKLTVAVNKVNVATSKSTDDFSHTNEEITNDSRIQTLEVIRLSGHNENSEIPKEIINDMDLKRGEAFKASVTSLQSDIDDILSEFHSKALNG